LSRLITRQNEEARMDDNTTENHDDRVHVEEIIQRIQENIRHRQTVSDLPCDPDSSSRDIPDSGTTDRSREPMQRDLSIIHSIWDLNRYDYIISSHHPVIGRILVKGRHLVHGEICRYVDPILSRQTEFNASTVRILTLMSQRCTELNEQMDKHQQEIHARIDTSEKESRDEANRLVGEIQNQRSILLPIVDQKISQESENQRSLLLPIVDQKISQESENQKALLLPIVDQKISQESENQKALLLPIVDQKISQESENQKALLLPLIEKKTDSRVRELISHMDFDIHAKTWLAQILEERVQKGLSLPGTSREPLSPAEMNYLLFEDRFRGPREDVKQRQLVFLPYFENCKHVLDIGCGRGEFLEILRDHSIAGVGVDPDADMIAYCRTRQLPVIQSDAITYLEQLEDLSLDGIFLDQVVEHLEPEYLIRMLALCHRKLKSGGFLVAETVNPLSFASFVNFYIDLTHKRPVHPLTLQFLAESAGFKENEVRFYSEIPDEVKLQKIPVPEKIAESKRNSLLIYNNNVELLNNLMWGPRDYAIIGKK